MLQLRAPQGGKMVPQEHPGERASALGSSGLGGGKGEGLPAHARSSPLCLGPHHSLRPSRLPPHLQRGFHMPTLALASPCAGWDSLDEQLTSGKTGKCESSVITMSTGGRFTQTFISISISSLSHHLLFLTFHL